MLKAQFCKVKNKRAAVLTGLQMVENVNAKSNQRSTEQYSDIQMTKGFFHVPDLVVQGNDVPRLAFDQLVPIAAGDVQRRVLPIPRAVVDTDPCSQIQVLAVPAALSHIDRLPGAKPQVGIIWQVKFSAEQLLKMNYQVQDL